MKQFPLQPLRIHSGWTVQYNEFTEYSPGQDDPRYAETELNEDLLRMKNNNLLIDLGWYPGGDISGRYALRLIDLGAGRPFDGGPLRVIHSCSKEDIVNALETWTDHSYCSGFMKL